MIDRTNDLSKLAVLVVDDNKINQLLVKNMLKKFGFVKFDTVDNGIMALGKVEENKYRLSLPDGNYNYYIYKNGLCTRVDIERTFFTVQFLLRKK